MNEQAADPPIEARGLRKVFDGHTAVDGIDLSVGKGEVFGLVGPDGAGKTTTLRMVCGALPPSDGRINLFGFDVVRQSEEAQRRLGYVSQRFSLYPELTIEENLLFRARAYGLSKKHFQERRDNLLAFTRLDRFRRRLTRNLSGGMKQKLALAAALLHEPEVLVLDEPTTGVDVVSRGEFWEMLLELAENGLTILLATVYMDEAERCQQVGLLFRGQLLLQGTPGEIRTEAHLNLLQVVCEPLLVGRQTAQKIEGIRWVEIFGNSLHVAVESQQVGTSLREDLSQAGVRVDAINLIAPGLEDAFFELIRQREAVA